MRRLRAEGAPTRAEARPFASLVEQAALDRRLDPASNRPLAVAFSGGGDSLAILLICLDWARRRGRKVVALTVDHGLHTQSAAWTRQAGAAAMKLGVDWRCLSWIDGDKPTTGIPAAAREARHRLLADAAREIGARVILFGHTADDVGESQVIRRTTPSLGRLRVWSPSPAWPQGRGVFLLRPLLGTRREYLRARLLAEGLSWHDDPANADLRFARARVRAELAGSEDAAPSGFKSDADESELSEGDWNEGDWDEGDGDEGDWDEGDLDPPLACAVSATSDGRLVVARRDISNASLQVARRVLGAALLCASGGTRPPRSHVIDRLIERLSTQLGGGAAVTFGIAGARIVADPHTVVFAREAGERARGGLTPIALSVDRPAVFDGRFEVRAAAASLTVAALAGRAGRLDRLDADRLRAYPAYARPSLPVLIDPDGQPSLPAPFGCGPGRVRALAADRFAAACGLVSCEARLDATWAV